MGIDKPEIPQADKVEGLETQAVEKQENNEQKSEKNEKSAYDVGEERLNKIGKAFGNIVEAAKKGVSKFAEGFKNFAKEFGIGAKEAAISALSAPETLAAGAVEVGGEFKKGGEWVANKTKEGAQFVGEKVKADIAATGEDFKKGAQFVGDKAKEGAKITGEAAMAVGKGVKTGAEIGIGLTVAAGAFALEQGGKAVEAGKKGLENAKEAGVKYFTKEWNTTVDHLKSAQEFAGKDWEKTKENAEAAIASIKLMGSEAKKGIANTTEKGIGAIKNKLEMWGTWAKGIAMAAESMKNNAAEAIKGKVAESKQKTTEFMDKLKSGLNTKVEGIKTSIATRQELNKHFAELKADQKKFQAHVKLGKIRDQKVRELAILNARLGL